MALTMEELTELLNQCFVYTIKDNDIRDRTTAHQLNPGAEVGSPAFIDRDGRLKTNELMQFIRAQAPGLTAETLERSYENWLNSGNKPPKYPGQNGQAVRPSLAFQATPTQQVANTEPIPQQGVDSLTKHYQELAGLNKAKADYERATHEMEMVNMQPNTPPISSNSNDQMMASLITALLAQISKPQKGSDSDLLMIKMLESQQMQAERARNDQAMLMQMMNQNSTNMFGLVIDSMRNGGGRSNTDEALIKMALDGIRSGGGTEESVFDSLVKSGQLAEITGNLAEGLRSVVAARAPPTGAPPSYAMAQTPLQPMMQQQPQMQFEPQPIPEMNFEQKCQIVMNEIHKSLPEEWKNDGVFIETMKRATEISVRRAEERSPVSLENQVQRAIMEMMIVVNIRTLGLSVNSIRQNVVGVDMAARVMSEHELWPVFQNETYESLIEIISSYIGADPPGVENLIYDIKFLTNPENRQVIEGVLEKAKQG